MIHNISAQGADRNSIYVRSAHLKKISYPLRMRIDSHFPFILFNGKGVSEILEAKKWDPPQVPFSLNPNHRIATKSLDLPQRDAKTGKVRMVPFDVRWGKVKLEITDIGGICITWEPVVAFTDAEDVEDRFGVAEGLIYLMPKFRLAERIIELEPTKDFPGKIILPGSSAP